MISRGVRHLLVTEGGELVGVLNMRDVVGVLSGAATLGVGPAGPRAPSPPRARSSAPGYRRARAAPAAGQRRAEGMLRTSSTGLRRRL